MSKNHGNHPPEKLLQAFDFANELSQREDAHREQLQQLLRALLGVVDSLDRRLSASESTETTESKQALAWRRSTVLINKQLTAVLRDVGVEPIDCLGQQADCELHEIVDTRSGSQFEDGVILEELVRGYRWRGMLLRRPRVIVATSPKE